MFSFTPFFSQKGRNSKGTEHVFWHRIELRWQWGMGSGQACQACQNLLEWQKVQHFCAECHPSKPVSLFFFPSLSRSTSFVYLFLFIIAPFLTWGEREVGSHPLSPWRDVSLSSQLLTPLPKLSMKPFQNLFTFVSEHIIWNGSLHAPSSGFYTWKIIFYRRILFSLEKKRKRRGGKLLRHQHFLTRENILPASSAPPSPSHVSAFGTPIPSLPPVSGAPWGHMGTRNDTTAPAPSGGETPKP